MPEELHQDRQSSRNTVAIAEFHRWFQLDDRPRTPDLIERQLERLATRFEGPASYKAKVRAADVNLLGSVPDARVVYQGELVGSVGLEPTRRLKITVVVRLGTTGQATGTLQSRPALSVVAPLSEPQGEGDRSDDLVAFLRPTGQLGFNLGVGAIPNRLEMANWLRDAAQRMASGMSRHSISGFHVVRTAEDDYTIAMDFDWTGVTADGNPLEARLRYEWSLRDSSDQTEDV